MVKQQVRIRIEVIAEVTLEKFNDEVVKRVARSLLVIPGDLDKDHVIISKQMPVPHSVMLI